MEIKTLHKKGDINNIASYRPISLLPSLSKVFEKVIYIRLLEHINNNNNILVKEQFGFRSTFSTEAASYSLISEVSNALNNKNIIMGKREEQRLEAAQMKFLRHLLGITKLDKGKNQCIREEMGAQNTVKEIKPYQKKWLQHVQRMDTNRIPKQALQYKPKGRRNTGRPRKRWRNQLHLEDQGTGNTPKPS